MSLDQPERAPPPLTDIFWQARLGTKLIITLVFVGLLGFAGMFAALGMIITPSFNTLERQEVQSHIDRTHAALKEYADRVSTAARDYGAWNESYDYVQAPTRQFESDTFSILAMTNLDINGMAYVKFNGDVVFSRWVDLEDQVEVQTLARQFDSLISSAGFLSRAKTMPSDQFYVRIDDRIAAFSIAQVIRTDGTGTPTAFVVMARELNSKQLSELLQLSATLTLPGKRIRPTISELDDRLDIAVNVPGLNKAPIAQARFKIKRELSALGLRTLFMAATFSTIVLFLTLFVLSHLIKRLAIQPIQQVERHMQRVTASGHLIPLESKQTRDEVGSLVQSFNSMLGQLKDLREQVEYQSFRLGRTESAVGVMHNVRNGLNPVNVILARIIADKSVVPVDTITRSLDELKNNQLEPERRQRLADFLAAALEAQLQHNRSIHAEMATAKTCLNRVVEMIGEQQEAAHRHVDTETCDLNAVVEQNAAIARYSTQGRVEFVVSNSPCVGQANRLLLSQVVGNLFANAVESITAVGRAKGLIEVTLSDRQDPSGNYVEIAVRDNGEGFTPDMGKRIFERGFSSRKEKSGGLGLHWCANAINLMAGSLSLSSDGPGLGATALIRLPASSAATAQHPEEMAEADQVPGNALAIPVREIQNRR